LTLVAGATLVPAEGDSLMTLPAATVALLCCVTDPTASPCAVMAPTAEAWAWPTTFGTVTIAGPLEIKRLTGEAEGTLAPAAGLELTT
jgi:hypothetical protein